MKKYAAGAALLLVLTGCSGNDDDARSAVDPGSKVPTAEATGTATPEAKTALLDWTPAGDPEDRVVTNGTWTAVTDADGTRTTLSGGERPVHVVAGDDRTISDVLLSEAFAVVVAQDKHEERPARATLVDLATGVDTLVEAPATTTGGPWALAGDTLLYATLDAGRYCLARRDLDAERGEVAWCAPRRQGWSNPTLSPAGVALMTFDDHRPVSCRTLVTLLDNSPEEVAGPEECTGSDIVATDDGAVWSTVPNERQVERGDFFARAGQTTYDLGPGVNDTLTWCGDSAWFARDAARGEPAQLLRWTPDATLEVAYEAPGSGEGFLSDVSCAGSVLTVTALGEGGDEVVSATVPG